MTIFHKGLSFKTFIYTGRYRRLSNPPFSRLMFTLREKKKRLKKCEFKTVSLFLFINDCQCRELLNIWK